MPTNTMTFNQIATVLNAIQQQVTGQSAIAPTNTADFVSVANTVLQTGYEPVINAISQILSRTIFSIRPYERKFGIVEVNESNYGNHVRKLSIADRPVDEDSGYKWPVAYDAGQNPPSGDGQSVDDQILKKPQILQTNFYGKNVFQDHYTIFMEQLDSAFTGPDQFGSFLAMVTQNMVDKLEQCRESMGRMTVANFIGGIIDENNSDRIVHLLTEYNTLTGLSLTAQTVMQPANYRAFVQWAYARILTISGMMTERSQKYQTVVNGLPIMRHTPRDRQKMMIYAPASYEMTTMAVANTYHDRLLQMGAYETVNFWQSIQTPDTIQVTPGRIGANGAVVAGNAVNQANVFGVLFDEEALGYAAFDQRSVPSRLNGRGRYQNIWFSEIQRLWNDHSEKGVVFLLD